MNQIYKMFALITLLTTLIFAAACSDDDPLAIGGINAPITNSDGAIGGPPTSVPANPPLPAAPAEYDQKHMQQVVTEINKIKGKTDCLGSCKKGKATAKRKKGKKSRKAKPAPKKATAQTAAPTCTFCQVLSISRSGVVKTNACCEGCIGLQFGYNGDCDSYVSRGQITNSTYVLNRSAYDNGCYLTNVKCGHDWLVITSGMVRRNAGICVGHDDGAMSDNGQNRGRAFRRCGIGYGSAKLAQAELYRR